jgi:hypothetical protein
MAGRPPTYLSDAEKPVSVSVRIPRELYEQAQQYVRMRRMTLTELLLDGLRLSLETPTDPRDFRVSDDSNTVMQQLQELVNAAVQAALATGYSLPTPPPAREASALSTANRPPGSDGIPHDDNTVLQKNPPRGSTPPRQYKLTPEQAAALRAKREQGTPIKALMAEYGLSKATVFRYLH